MTGKQYENQAELDAELADLQTVLGDHPCDLVEGEPVLPGTVGVPVDNNLKRALQEKFVLLDKTPDVPQFVLYQLKTGQRSVICIGKDKNGKFIFSYRDFDTRPPTKRVKETMNEAVAEYLKS